MNTKRIIVLLVIAAVALVLWEIKTSRLSPSGQNPTIKPPPSRFENRIIRHEPPPGDTHVSAKNNPSDQKALIANYAEQMRADPLYEFKIPMRFYGKVLDEAEKPIEEANVHFEWNNLTPTNDIERKILETKTDGQGLFSMDGQSGKRLNVTVSKTGYYASKQNPLAFEFADPASGAYYSPDSQNPVAFHLKKKGQRTQLITSKNGMRSNVKLSIPMDGTPISVDLLHQKAADIGPLQVSQTKPTMVPWQRATEWSFKMSIPDGGFVESHDEFPFEAPEGGYQPTVQLDFHKDSTNWTTGIKSDYYIRFGNPSMYGLLHLETSITDAGAQLTYSINPAGSRNLEPQ